METLSLAVDERAATRRALRVLRRGGVILFPTDTVYGVGGIATSWLVAARVGDLKRRPREKVFPWLVSDLAMARRFARFSPEAEAFARRAWPGAVTIVLTSRSPKRGTVALRVPAHPWLRRLMKQFGKPLIGTSANVSAQHPAWTAHEAALAIPGADLLVDGGRCAKAPSIVVDYSVSPPRIIRIRTNRRK